MKQTWRLIWVTSFLSLFCVAAAFLTLNAAAQNADPRGTSTTSATVESGPIEDDPVIAPDPQESADNNVTFPVDI